MENVCGALGKQLWEPPGDTDLCKVPGLVTVLVQTNATHL